MNAQSTATGVSRTPGRKGLNKGDAAHSTRPLHKWKRILKCMADAGHLTRFDAERLGDHCLNSTISRLQRRGIHVMREQIELEGRFGVIHCCRYWLDAGE